MAIKRISIEGNLVTVELDELDAKILARAEALAKPLIELSLLMTSELILSLASMDRDQVRELRERLSRGEEVGKVFSECGIDTERILRKVGEVKWPTDKEIAEALAWN